MFKIKLLIIGLVIFVPFFADAAITLDATSSATSASSPLTFPHTVGAGSDNFLLVCAGAHQGTITGVTYATTSMTRAILSNTAFNETASIWWMDDPPEGLSSVVVSGASASEWQGIAMSFFGANGTSSVASSTGTAAVFTTRITNTGIDSWVIDCANAEASLTKSGDDEQKTMGNVTADSFEVTAASRIQTTDRGRFYTRWTVGSSQRYAHAMLELTSVTSTDYAITTDTVSDSGEGVSVTSLTFAHTVSAGTNQGICVGSSARDATAADMVMTTAPTFNGDNMTQIRSDVTSAGFQRSEIWCLATPDVATGNVVVTYDGTVSFAEAQSWSVFGIDQSDIDAGNNGQNNTTGASSTLFITTDTANCYLWDAIYTDIAPGTITYSASQFLSTIMSPNTDGDVSGWSRKRTTTAGVYSMVWDWLAIDSNFGHSAVCLKPAPAAAAGSSPVQGAAELILKNSWLILKNGLLKLNFIK